MGTSSEKKLSILGHTYELRHRLVKSVIAVLVTTIVSFVFANQIFHIFIVPTQGIDLVYIEMTGMIGTYMKVCLAAGIALALPYFWFLLMFIFPALNTREKKCAFLIIPWVALMFVGGVVFGYFVLIPPAYHRTGYHHMG